MGRESTTQSFSEFMEETEPRVRRALISGYGSQLGREATVEAYEYVWEHWEHVRKATNPAGYVYKTGAHCAARSRRQQGRRAGFEKPPTTAVPWVEPELNGALHRLSPPQRTSVVLIYGFDWTYQEVADLLGVRRSTVQRHVSRALNKLRSDLGVQDAVA